MDRWMLACLLGCFFLLTANASKTGSGQPPGVTAGSSVSTGSEGSGGASAFKILPISVEGEPPLVLKSTTDETPLGNGPSTSAVTDDACERIAFQSDASNIVYSTDQNGATDVFLRDLGTQTNHLLSVDQSGLQGSLSSSEPSITHDGAIVAFQSQNSLHPDDLSSSEDIYVRDVDGQTTHLISRIQGTGLAGGSSVLPEIARTGDSHHDVFIAYFSAAALIPSDTNGVPDFYLSIYNSQFQFQQLLRLNLTSGGQESLLPAIEFPLAIQRVGDSIHIAFSHIDCLDQSFSGICLPGYLHMYEAKIPISNPSVSSIRIVDISEFGDGGFGTTVDPTISQTGSIAFSSDEELLGGDGNYATDVFIDSFASGGSGLSYISHAFDTEWLATGGQSGSASLHHNHVAFISDAADSTSDPLKGPYNDLLLKEIGKKDPKLITKSFNGSEAANGNSYRPDLAGSGGSQCGVFHSDASNLVAGDDNLNTDVFLFQEGSGPSGPKIPKNPILRIHSATYPIQLRP